MTMKVYGLWRSPFVKTVIFTLYEKNAEFELVLTDNNDVKVAEYMETKNPFGKMPAFEDGDLVLFESRAIARYVVSKFEGQGTPLFGSNAKEQALVNVWIDVESQNFLPPMLLVGGELLYKSSPEQDRALIETNLEKLGKVLDIYEVQLAKHKYLAGDFFSLADLCHTSVIHFFLHLADPVQQTLITSRPRVHAWHQDIIARPAWQKISQIPEASDWSDAKRARYDFDDAQNIFHERPLGRFSSDHDLLPKLIKICELFNVL